MRIFVTVGIAIALATGVAWVGYQAGTSATSDDVDAGVVGAPRSAAQTGPTVPANQAARSEDSASAVLPQPVTPTREDITRVQDTLELPTDFLQTAALYALIERADIDALKRHIAEAKALGSTTDRSAALAIIYLRFSELDSNGAIDHLYATGGSARDNVLYTVFFSWAKRDLDAAIARAKRVGSSADRNMIAGAIMRAYSDRDLAFLVELADRIALNPQSAGAFAGQILAARVERDPQAAMEMALSLEAPEQRRMAMYQVAQAWARIDPWGAYRYAETVTNRELAQQLRSGSLYRMAEMDAEQTLQLLDTDVTRQEKSTIVSAAMRQLARQDPERALVLARDLNDFELRNEALSTVFNAWANTDPRAAAKALTSIDNPAIRRGAGWGIASAYARLAPQEAMDWAWQLEGRAGDLFRSVVTEVSQSDPELALRSLAKLPSSSNRAQLEATVLGSLAQSDPAIAITYAEDMAPGQGRVQAMTSIANIWASSDPESAMEWVLTRSAQEQSQLLTTIGYSIAANNSALALSYVERLDGNLRNSWVGQVLNSLSYQNPDAALDWLSDHRDDPKHDEWAQNIISNIANTDPRRALAVIDTLQDGAAISNARQQLAYQWAAQDPESAARWAGGLDDRDPSLVQAIVGAWQSYDPAAARRWVNSLDSGADRDAGLVALTESGQLTTQEVTSLISRITDSGMRENAVRSHAFNLAQSDADAAIAFVESADLSAESRGWLLQSLEQMRGGG